VLLSDVERHLLDRAVGLGRAGWGRVHPNPMVGCVLARDGTVVGEGWHEHFGGPHAEVAALRSAGDEAAGATAFVSLEPCGHHGKTPPCTEALVRAGVARVVFAAADPGAEASGGSKTLRRGGIEVIGPVWDRDTSRAENPSFYHASERESPWIAVKLAQSRDGMIAAGPGRRTQLTSAKARHWVHELRAGFDAILVGSETARVDDPRLSVREGVSARVAPTRVVFDTDASLSPSAAMLSEPGGPVFVVTGQEANEERTRALESAGARILAVASGSGGIEVSGALSALWELGVRSILCEGGGVLASGLIGGGWVERLYLLTAPLELGPKGVPVFGPTVGEAAWREWRPFGEPRWLGPDRLGVFRRRY